MGFFFKKDKVEKTLPQKYTNNLPDLVLSVHPDIKDLLWIENGPYKNWEDKVNTDYIEVMGVIIQFAFGREEPSLINLDAPISMDNLLKVEPPQYYPSYKQLTPQQRGVYWNFLKNPFSGNYDISYVFILYYGLERHLYQGNYEQAVNIILRLRKVYNNKSFQTYSGNAIVLTSLARKRPDFILRLYEERDNNIDSSLSIDMLMLCKLGLKEALFPKDLMMSPRAFGFTNTKYMKQYPELYMEALSKITIEDPILINDYITENEFHALEKKSVPIYANYSLDNRYIEIPSITGHKGLSEKVKNELKRANEIVKDYIKRQGMIVKTDEVKTSNPKKQKEFDEKREREVLHALENADGYVGKHFALIGVYEFYYSYRDVSPDNLNLSEKYAKEDISILDMVKDEFQISQLQKRKEYMAWHIGNANKKELDQLFPESFFYIVPAFKRLCIIYEQRGDYAEALKICKQAIDFYTDIEHEEELAAFQRRKIKLQKKYSQTEE